MTAKPPPSEARLAARAVAIHEEIPAVERKLLLDALGLLDATGTGFAEPFNLFGKATTHAEAKGMSNRKVVRQDARVGRERWAAAIPEGLRNYNPGESEKKALRNPPKPRAIPVARPESCGSLAGRSRHQKRGEKLCDACRIFYNQYQAEARKRRDAARKGQAA